MTFLAELEKSCATAIHWHPSAECAELMEKYKALCHGRREQEYFLMKKGKVGKTATEPFGVNDHGSEPAPPGPYDCSAIERERLYEHS